MQEVLVVTGQKNVESIQKVPVSLIPTDSESVKNVDVLALSEPSNITPKPHPMLEVIVVTAQKRTKNI